MKQTLRSFAAIAMAAVLFSACQKDVREVPQQDEISQDVLNQIAQLGFSKQNVQKIDEGYLVEGDIILTQENLQNPSTSPNLIIANEEQYRTTNLVNAGTGRSISVSLDAKLAAISGYASALQEMVTRYNTENLLLKFTYLSSGTGNIHFVNANGPYLASAGFPSGGNPYSQVKVYSRNIGSGTSKAFIDYVATIFAHEVGHCIGFRHTDYMDRSYSCGGAYANEGASSVGAIHIAGTPTGPDPNSWMLACISRNQNRPFNSNDKKALSTLY